MKTEMPREMKEMFVDFLKKQNGDLKVFQMPVKETAEFVRFMWNGCLFRLTLDPNEDPDDFQVIWADSNERQGNELFAKWYKHLARIQEPKGQPERTRETTEFKPHEGVLDMSNLSMQAKLYVHAGFTPMGATILEDLVANVEQTQARVEELERILSALLNQADGEEALPGQ